MKTLLQLVLFISLPLFSSPILLEAEEGLSTSSLTIESSLTGYSGSGYVGNFSGDTDTLTLTVEINSPGSYQLSIIYAAPFGDKTQIIQVNGQASGLLVTQQNNAFDTVSIGGIWLKSGTNTIAIIKDWGWVFVDACMLSPRPANSYTPTSTLIDPNITPYTQALYDRIRSGYGSHIISGIHDTRKDFDGDHPNYTQLTTLINDQPLLRSFDLSNYSTLNPWFWEEDTHVLGYVGALTTEVEGIIEWQSSTKGRGMVELTWHWHTPIATTAGVNNFYTINTDFDVRQAITEGTQEYSAIIEDIDSIAIQLKRLAAQKIPVLWRPLHEAGGGWFWWGAHGPEAAITLWGILYERLTTYHRIHNLIWIWSTPEEEWYPGNNMVDIIGYDSYPEPFNYGSQKSLFDQHYDLGNGEKMVAMTENGSIPTIDALFTEDAPWAWWSTWADRTFEDNSADHLTKTFAHPKVLTIARSRLIDAPETPIDSTQVESSTLDVLVSSSIELLSSQSEESAAGKGLSSSLDSSEGISTLYREINIQTDLPLRGALYTITGTKIYQGAIHRGMVDRLSPGLYMYTNDSALPSSLIIR
ncbi:MAG: glycosyl hydrolase [Fibrobacterales bacterium]